MNWPKFFRYQKWRGTKRIVVNPVTTIDLDHRAEFICTGPPGVEFVVASSTGHISLIRDGLVLPSPPKYQHIYDISAHPAKPWLFVADGVDGSIKVVGISGEQIAELPGVPVDEQRDHHIPFGLTACCFDPRRGLLWCAGAVSDSIINVRIFEIGFCHQCPHL